MSSRFPAPASDLSHSVVHKMSYPERSAVAPMWGGGLQLIDDPYTLAQSGSAAHHSDNVVGVQGLGR